MIFQLDNSKVAFPDPHNGEPDGLIAIGGDLTPEWLLTAYSYGIFPWFDYMSNRIYWYCPMKRFVIFPSEIHISHSLRQLIHSHKYRLSWNEDFNSVIEGCSTAQGRDKEIGAWLGGRMIPAYEDLNKLGYAKSIEVWDDEKLIGGLYGVTLGRGFLGESMFSLAHDASKLALVCLADIVRDCNGIIDCQFETPHLKSMGGRYIDYEEYLTYIDFTGS